MNIPAIVYWILFVTLVTLDRITKYWALSVADQNWSLNKYVQCDVVINRGISWSMFDGDNALVFVLVSCAIIAIIVVFAVYTYHRATRVSVIPHVVVLAGACSNMIDRVQYHGVVDFIALQFRGYHAPIFNVADMCIVLGILALLWHERDE